MKKKKLSSAEIKQLKDAIKELLPECISDLCNAEIRVLHCYYKSGIQEDINDRAETDAMIYRDTIKRIFCIHNTSEEKCTYK